MSFSFDEINAALAAHGGASGEETSAQEGHQEANQSPGAEETGQENRGDAGEASGYAAADHGEPSSFGGRPGGDNGQVGEPTTAEQPEGSTELPPDNREEDSWSKLLAQRSLLHRQEQTVKKRMRDLEERQSRLDAWEKQQKESAALLEQDPVEWFNQQNLPADFFDRYIRKLNGETELESPGVKAMRSEFDRLRSELEEERRQRYEAETSAKAEQEGRRWLEGLRGELAKPEYAMAAKWPNIENEAATLIVGWKNEYGELLTQRQALDKLLPKIREYVERFTGSTPSPRVQNPGAGHSPKTITNQAAAAASPPASNMTWEEKIAATLRKHGA